VVVDTNRGAHGASAHTDDADDDDDGRDARRDDRVAHARASRRSMPSVRARAIE